VIFQSPPFGTEATSLVISLIIGGVLLATAVGTGVLRWLALRDGVLDIPNERSSHSVPTPRAGGVAIVVAICVGALGLWRAGLLNGSAVQALVGGGVVLALIGFVDDHRPVLARWRLLAHVLATWWVLYALGGLPPVEFFGSAVALGTVGTVLGMLGLSWLLNLYNFMDGIDGIASVEAITTCLGGIVLANLVPEYANGWALPSVVAAAAAGFLLWNLPQAKVFMGDAGSCFLGLSLGMAAVIASSHAPRLLWAWIILLGVFVVDATVTLIRRILRGAKIATAHRSHAYQHAAITLGRHGPVTLAVAAINLFWLLPVAILVGTGRLHGMVGVAVAYLPLVLGATRLGAGKEHR